MKKLLLAFLLLLPTTALASTQVILTNNVAYTSGTGVQDTIFGFGVGSNYNNGKVDSVRSQMAVPGTINTMRVMLNHPPGSGTSYAFTLYQNGANTSLTCTIADSATACTDLTHTVTVAAGDRLGWEITPTNTPVPIAPSFAVNFTPTTNNDTIVISSGGNTSLTVNTYIPFSQTTGGFSTTNANQSRVPMAVAGTLDQFYMKIQNAHGSGSSQWAFRIANATTSLACSIANAATTCTDLSDTASVSANDTEQIVNAPSSPGGLPGVTQMGARFLSTVPGKFLFFAGTASTGGTGTIGSLYYAPMTGILATTSEADAQMVTNAMDVTNLSVITSGTPGTGKSLTFTFDVNTVATGITCTIANSNSTCSASGFVHVKDGDLINVRVDNVGGATVGAHYSIAASSGDNFFAWWLLLLASLI